jgi:hypothetical protein
MKDSKTMFRFFTLFEFEEEQAFLEEQHRKGWKAAGCHLPGFYSFKKCGGAEYTYRIDFTDEKVCNQNEYRKLFDDNGWEFLWTANGLSIFRKEGKSENEDNEIFTDNESKINMLEKIQKRRLLPLAVIFLCIVIPNFLNSFSGHFGSDVFGISLSVLCAVIFAFYIWVFAKSFFKIRALKNKFSK